MKRSIVRIALFAFFFVAGATPSFAQATRTWVSGVGDDANPCSRTAPCKTFAGAISKTAAGGEINAIDPGGFGAVTITKAISIIGEGVTAGILAAGTNGVIVNAGVNDNVVLRGLDIEGAGTGLNGIRFLAGGTLHVENCTINGFTQTGIAFIPSGASRLSVEDTVVRDNNPLAASTYGGIFIAPTGTGSADASIDETRLVRNFHGLRVQGNSRVSARNCSASGHSGTGILAASAGLTQINLDGCEASNNVNGIRSEGAGTIVRIANTLVTNNSANGLFPTAGGAIVSFGNNQVAGNGTNGAPTSTVPEM
jgi:hypothetical protein